MDFNQFSPSDKTVSVARQVLNAQTFHDVRKSKIAGTGIIGRARMNHLGSRGEQGQAANSDQDPDERPPKLSRKRQFDSTVKKGNYNYKVLYGTLPDIVSAR
jgi:hypothetical protein